MRHAYLILAHTAPTMLARLVRALEGGDAAFYIHIDRRTDPAPFARALTQFREVRFVEPVRVNWMGFSMVDATLRLMTAAQQQGYDRYSLISGQDYPIKSNSHIADLLGASASEHISYWRIEDRPSWWERVQLYYPIDVVPLRNYRETVFRRIFWSTYGRLQRFMPKKRFPRGMMPYGGSQWWTMTHDCVSYVLDFLRANESFVRFYRTAYAPDEGFFQTIVMNSDFAGRAAHLDLYRKWRADVRPWTPASRQLEKERMLPEGTFNLRYVDWSGDFDGLREAPAVLDMRDFDALSRSDCLFARKFDERRSEALLDRIDREFRA